MKKEMKVIDKVGIHIRPASLITKEASKYRSNIELHYNGRVANVKSIMSLMSLGIPYGAAITLQVEGSDCEKALEGVQSVMESQGLAK